MSDSPDSGDTPSKSSAPNDDKSSVRREPARARKARRTKAEKKSPETPELTAEAPDETIVRKDATEPKPPESGDDGATVVRTKGVPNATILREPGGKLAPGRGGERQGTGRGFDGAERQASPAGNEDATVVNRSGHDDAPAVQGNEDATVIGNPAGDDATVITADHSDDSTVINAASGDDSTVVGSGRGGIDTTYVAGDGQPGAKRGNSEAGRLLKNRFVLEQRVGSGGMGDVYKALDLRQQEAQEKNPYIAIKILNESFARHKDAFISLQREATRTRGIPHPNIMAVYDFDREGDTVFMSMELLDGKPLDDYLKDHPEGVSIDDSWNIIDGICQGISRAHGAGIVHSDFKPGNIYYTSDKIAKVFDFGIARAVSSPGDIKAEGDKTVFDAGSLGALTPTYASLEMLTGKEPTKSDDVYAVALVAYELFTGKHPYERTPADKALDRGMEPEPIPFLRRRHWRALKKGLALRGEDRWQTIDEFYEGMFTVDPPYFKYAAVAAVLMLSVGFAAYSFMNVEEVPRELTELQGRLGADVGNLVSRLGPVGVDLTPSKWNFESPEWRAEIRQSLSRMRGVSIELEQQWTDAWQKMPEDQKPDVEQWKSRVLRAYLVKVRSIAEEVQAVQLSGDSTRLEEDRDLAGSLLLKLDSGRALLQEAESYFNFDPQAIRDEYSRLQQATQFRDFQRDSIVADITERENQRIAAEQRQQELEARQRFEEERFQAYATGREEFASIMRCKGDIDDPDLAKLGPTLVGQRGLANIWPEQFAKDRPGMVSALRGCITQRVAIRDPDRARTIKAHVLTIFPGEQALASISIEDLDPCAARSLEGKGNSNGRWCSDRLATGGSGPEMVVIPKVGGDTEKFAISRIEIKVSDYNSFCEATGCRQISGPGTIPVTNISLTEAEAYAAWLSDQTGKRYRLPTPQEWLLAARTDRVEPLDDNINCSVDARGVRLGEKLLSTLSGRPNGWGLYNYVGNAREWAVDGDAIVAMGGAHTDPKPECTIDKKVSHSGNPDAITGFRILRSIEDKSRI